MCPVDAIVLQVLVIGTLLALSAALTAFTAMMVAAVYNMVFYGPMGD